MVAPNVIGLELFESISKQYPDIQIIAYSSLASPILVENLLTIGVKAYVNKKHPLSHLLKAIKCILDGRIYVPDDYAFLVKKSLFTEKRILLSRRETEVLELIQKGKLTKEIAAELYISKNTVNNHRVALFNKFDVGNMAELIRKAMQLGYGSDL